MHADIFFFITSIAVIIVGIGVTIAVVFCILILRDLRAIVRKVRKASDELEQDFEALRSSVKGEGARVKTVFDLALGFIARQVSRSHTRRKRAKESAGEGEE